MTSRTLKNILKKTTIEKAKTEYIKALGEGWSSTVAIARAKLTYYQFRVYLKHDKEVSEAFNKYNEKKKIDSRGFAWHYEEKERMTTAQRSGNTSKGELPAT